MQWIRGEIVGRKVWTDGLFTLSIQAPGVQSFEPGQFLQLGMDQPEKHLHRPYSVASPHGDILEFFIVLVEEGHLTPKLWAMREGDAIDVSAKAAGSFTLSHVPSNQCLWLIATGTGLAPYVAMLREGSLWNKFQKVVVVHGVRHARDLAYQDEFDQYHREKGDAFCYIPAVSRETIANGISGRITTALANGELAQRGGVPITKDTSTFMLCGNPDMLDEMENTLVEAGLHRHKAKNPGQIVVERYW